MDKRNTETVKNERNGKIEKKATFGWSLAIFVVVICILMFGILGLGQSAHIPLLTSMLVVTAYGYFVLNISLDDMENAVVKSAKEAPFMILISIGILIASWVICGTVPYIVYLGLKLINPAWFLAFVCLACTILSTVTGSSWTTIGTLGVAFMGISLGLGIPLGMTVGAICCGAFFGDKQSPVSDYAVFAAGVAKCNIYRHAKYMLYTSGPSIVGAFLLFLFIGFGFHSTTAELSEIEDIISGLEATFHFSTAMWIPLVALAAAIFLKLPATYSLLASAVTAIFVAIFAQGYSASEVIGFLYNGVSMESGNEVVDTICNRGGMASMVYNITMLLSSLSLAGAFGRTKVLSEIVDKLAFLIKSRFSLVFSTFLSSTVMSFFTGDPFIGGVIPCSALGRKYEEFDIDRAVLSRTISDAAAVQQPIVPWGVSGVYVVQCLGVPVSQFAFYYFIGWLTPIFSVICAITGLGCPKSTQKEEVLREEAEGNI